MNGRPGPTAPNASQTKWEYRAETNDPSMFNRERQQQWLPSPLSPWLYRGSKHVTWGQPLLLTQQRIGTPGGSNNAGAT
eukprot:4421829-Amphidinium_carterae.1